MSREQVITCDRCKAVLGAQQGRAWLDIYPPMGEGGTGAPAALGGTGVPRAVDLCVGCWKLFLRFFKGEAW